MGHLRTSRSFACAHSLFPQGTANIKREKGYWMQMPFSVNVCIMQASAPEVLGWSGRSLRHFDHFDGGMLSQRWTDFELGDTMDPELLAIALETLTARFAPSATAPPACSCATAASAASLPPTKASICPRCAARTGVELIRSACHDTKFIIYWLGRDIVL